MLKKCGSNPFYSVVKILLAGLLCTGTFDAAQAVTLSLDEVVGNTAQGKEVRYVLEVRATFDYDPDQELLTSSGTWIAENRTGPNLLIRYDHKVENLTVSMSDGLFMKSYECVEGTFGATILRNYCGNYRFGPNQADDGGFVDDISTGLPVSLYHFEPVGMVWDGKTLTLTLAPLTSKDQSSLPELGMTLKFTLPDDESPDTA